MKLVAHYFPLTAVFDPSPTPTSETYTSLTKGTAAYHYHCVGGGPGLARLYIEAGSLYLEGAAAILLSSTYSALSSIRSSTSTVQAEGGVVGWRRDREFARKYFERAGTLDPSLDVPVVPPEIGDELGSGTELLMPSIEIKNTAGTKRGRAGGSTTGKTRRRTGTVMGTGKGRGTEESEVLASEYGEGVLNDVYWSWRCGQSVVFDYSWACGSWDCFVGCHCDWAFFLEKKPRVSAGCLSRSVLKYRSTTISHRRFFLGGEARLREKGDVRPAQPTVLGRWSPTTHVARSL
jgi:hypothetical protein